MPVGIKLIYILNISLKASLLAPVITLTMGRGIVESIYLDSLCKMVQGRKLESYTLHRWGKYMDKYHNVNNQSTWHHRAIRNQKKLH